MGKLGWIRVPKCERTNACGMYVFFLCTGLLGQIAKSCVMSMDWVINSNIGFCFCLEVLGEGEYVVCVYIMNEWIKKGQKRRIAI